MPKKPTPKARNSKGRRKTAPTPVDAIKHKDARVNIPTHELRDFVREEESTPPPALYARDPSLDPQLVWSGKDQQDGEDLSVPVVPIYIQEKIHPQALVENLRDTARANEAEPELSLFADFNGVDDFDKKVDFYHHEGHWSNRMILGDSLLVMNSLSMKEGLAGKVQTIYMDPPYGIKFGSNWQVSTRKRDVKDGKAEHTTRQPEQVRAFRDTWKLGIHSYLAYLRDRLVVARTLLTETGSAFVQIGDENVHLVRCVLDEVFGSENFISQITFRKKLMPLGAKTIESMADFILWYAKDKEHVKYRQLYRRTEPEPSGRWTGVEENGRLRRFHENERADFSQIPAGARIFGTVSQWAPSFSAANVYDFDFQGTTYKPAPGQCWVTSAEKMRVLGAIGRLFVEGASPRYVVFHDDFEFAKITNPWDDTAPAQKKTYVVQTNETVIERCLLMTTDPGDLVLDPTCGSGTTAFVAEQWGRRWITCDTSRVALALARTRLMAAKYPYYLLADSPEGIRKEAELVGQMPREYNTDGDIRKGFVYERVAHVTLKSIVNNPEIHADMRREDLDAAIARGAEIEVLYDKPYTDNTRIRVTGPFTVESLSPHRVLTADADRPASEVDGLRSSAPAQFETMVLENLRRAGVQNARKAERLSFQTLDIYPGTWINASGTYIDSSGKQRRVAVSIGPEHGTVGPTHIKEAAKEAVQGIGYDTLIVCGFAFDPHVSEESKRYGKLTVLPAHMNPDLAMGDELLKKTGAANLFMVFGEPDIRVRKSKDAKTAVEILGLDVYDPTTGEIRSSTTDDIACWFIDTLYNGESFFVRHAYFTGADKPYEKLQRALRSEIDQAVWQSLYSTVSRPFDRPETGRIAVKVINHFGDEVLKVIPIE
jgi:adenine-specific DNA-methyltransferase